MPEYAQNCCGGASGPLNEPQALKVVAVLLVDVFLQFLQLIDFLGEAFDLALDIEDFGDFFVSTGLVNDLSGTDSKAFDAALQKLVMKYFDDSHSFLIKPSYLTGPSDLDDADTNLSLFGDAGTSYNTKVWDGTRIKIIRSRYYPDHPELYPDGDDELPGWSVLHLYG